MTIKRAIFISVTLVAIVAVAVPTALWAANRRSSSDHGRVDRQSMEWVGAPLSTSSQEFQDVSDPNTFGDEGITVTNRGPATITFTGDFSGGQVELRGLKDSKVAQPGTAVFDPTNGTTTATFTFFAPGGNRVSCRTYSIQWRSPTGKEITLNHGGFVVTYNHDDTTKDGLRIGCV